MCNMNCSYCFYRDETEKRKNAFCGLLSEETAETIVKKASSEAEESCFFMFQGGEPTLAGIEFYKYFVSLEKKYSKPGLRFFNAIQTNGYAINEEWARFFAENSFLTGISVDGPADVHNMNRKSREGDGTFNKVMHTVDLFDKYKVDYNVLCVITSVNIKKAEKIYNFYSKRNLGYLQFIPCLEPLGEDKTTDMYAPDEKEYGDFLVKIFRLWFADLKKGKYVSIRHIDNFLRMFRGLPPESCNMNGRCSVQFVTEADGTVYPCDFYCIDGYELGNIKEKSFSELAKSDNAVRFINESLPLPEECRQCRFYPFCRNGCRRDRAENGKTLYCGAYRRFFEECGSELIAASRFLIK